MNKKCPKCSGIMVKDCCIKCGYMSNGNVAGSYIPIDNYKDLKIYDNNFDEMYRNENTIVIFLLGPLNFSYRNHPFIGGILSVVHILLFFKVSEFLNPVSKINYFTYLLFHLFYLLIIRVLYCVFVNRIILKIDMMKIKMIKKISKSKEEYYAKLNNHNDKSIGSVVLSLLISICIFLIILIIYVN